MSGSGLSGALLEYYNSPGRLAIYRRKFENVIRREEQDLSVFAMELLVEILAVMGFGDASPRAQTRMVRDRFVSGHRDCVLR